MSRDRVTLVTGATGVLGAVVAADLAAAGGRVVLVGRDRVRLDALLARLPGGDDRHAALDVDLRDREVTERAVEAAVERFGRIDHVAHLVGGWAGGEHVADLEDEVVASMLDQHVWTPLNVVRAVCPHMVAAGFGRIVAVSTPLAVDPRPGMAAYAVGKAGLEALFSTLAREVAAHGITVNLLRVRKIDEAHERDAARAADASSRVGASWTTPEEISAAIGYLFSDMAGAVNGEALALDGGG